MKKININTIAPGPMPTKMAKRIMKNGKNILRQIIKI